MNFSILHFEEYVKRTGVRDLAEKPTLHGFRPRSRKIPRPIQGSSVRNAIIHFRHSWQIIGDTGMECRIFIFLGGRCTMLWSDEFTQVLSYKFLGLLPFLAADNFAIDSVTRAIQPAITNLRK